MKIGIMLRHLGQHGGGVLVYTHNLLREMLALNTSHELVLLYREPCWLGPFSNGNKGRVREMAMGKSPHHHMGPVAGAPDRKEKEKFDLIFNPKYSLPLVARY